MIVTITVVVFLASIVVFFSEEFSNTFKKISSIPGFLLVAPILVASWIVSVYEVWGYWLIIKAQAWLHQLALGLASYLPFEKGSLTLVYIIILFLIAILPIWLSKIRHMKKAVHQSEFAYWLGVVLWLIGVILIAVIFDADLK